MKVLVIGSGGREHALCWALSASPMLTTLYCAPGNPGIGELATCVDIAPTDIESLVAFALDNAIDLVVPGPEAPLVAGLTDAMEAASVACCGPSKAAAQLEGSKSFTKELCDAASIPTALWERFDDAAQARDFIRRRGAPIVVKADGLAGGKGVVVAQTEAEALAAIDAMMERRVFGEAGAAVVLEECLTGQEVSLFALCDGKDAIILGSAADHKRVGDNDTGPNTGGMGAYSPVPDFPPALEQACLELIIRPALQAMVRQGSPFRGILFAGLMLTDEGAKLIEFNVRFGDPECQALLCRLQSDLLPALQAACDGELGSFDLRWREEAAVAVVMAARGYPEAPERGTLIGNLEQAARLPGVQVFHNGTAAGPHGLTAAGGRVLTICGTAPTLPEARARAYAAIRNIPFDANRHRLRMTDSTRGDRIAKFLSRAGVASRRDAERLLAEGAIRLNGQTVSHPATFVTLDDVIQVHGRVVDPPDRTRMWRYHKPDGLVTTHRDPEGRPTVFDKLRSQLPRVVSVGRLDLTSEGLLLLTNDGGLARRLELPSTGWLRRYRVRVFGRPDEAALRQLSRGVTIDGIRYGPIEAAVDAVKGENAWLTVGLREGRNREVRRVMAHLGYNVSRLIRTAYGPFQLGTLERGGVEEIPTRILRAQLPADAAPAPQQRRRKSPGVARTES
jgi:phosphoribosylamine--glycine ligase